MKKVAFHIQKVGTGKTTLAGNVAWAAARDKMTVLVDADPQGNASSWFLKQTPDYELAAVLKGTSTVQDTLIKLTDNLSILPTFGIDGTLKQYTESKLLDEPYIFEDLCDELEKRGFELAVFDLSPGMSRLEKCVLLAMDEVITPLTPEFFSVDGIVIFNHELQKLNKAYRKNVQHKKVVCNGLNKNFCRHNAFYSQFDGFEKTLFTVPQDAKLAESQAVNQSIFEYAPGSKSIPEIERLTSSLTEM